MLSARASQQLRGGGANNPDDPVSQEGPVSCIQRVELGPNGHLAAGNPNTRQGPLASNKPSRLQNQAREPRNTALPGND